MVALDQDENAVNRLLDLVASVESELHPGRSAAIPITLDSLFDRELAFDSLGQMELFQRVEQAFNVTLPETLFSSIETPRDMLRYVLDVSGIKSAYTMLGAITDTQKIKETVPNTAETLIDVLKWHVNTHPNRITVRFYSDDEGESDSLTYQEVFEGAARVAVGLQNCRLEHGEAVAIMLASSKDYFFSFLGILLAGGVPVPIYPPARLKQLEDHLNRHSAILNNCLAGILITLPEAKLVANLMKLQVPTLHHVVTPAELEGSATTYLETKLKPTDFAFLQYTSGSTGTPKGVIVTHANLLANIRAMGTAAHVTSDDVIVSWLPLYHDMGLVGAWLGSLYYACPLVILSPLAFLTRPKRWLWAIHRYRGTISAAPNFAYELAMRNFNADDYEGLDLSSWRFALNGAEGVSPKTIRRFCDQFAPFGFIQNALSPVYGLAENTVGVAFPPLKRGARIERVNRATFLKDGIAHIDNNMDNSGLDFVGCGQVLPWHQIRIVDAKDRELPERHEGRLQFCGPSATQGYFRNSEQTQRLFHGDWLDTEDLAYISDGELFITGRSKDIIIKAGRNIYPVELEEAVGTISGVRKGNVAVFGATSSAQGTEQLIVVAETRETQDKVRQEIETNINQVTLDVIGSPPDRVLLVPPGSVLKTSSGKIRRKDCAGLYETGQIGKSAQSVWIQTARFAFKSSFFKIHSRMNSWQSAGYAVYSWTVILLIAPALWLSAMILPAPSWRWTCIRKLVQFTAKITATPLSISGLENLNANNKSCIFTANHTSYLDHFAIIATLPRRIRFVAKKELSQNPFLRWPLQRMDVEFVERADTEKGITDAKHLAEIANKDENLLFYPEGTFRRMPGLLPFHMGAFMAAIDARVPIIPIAIRGSRSILRDGSWFPRKGSIRITIGTPIVPAKGSDGAQIASWTEAVKCRDAARSQLLHLSGEPDLSLEYGQIEKDPDRINTG